VGEPRRSLGRDRPLTVAAVIAAVIGLLFVTAACMPQLRNIDPKGSSMPGADRPAAAPATKKADVRILQIGDSHTAADFFTGEARRILQARFGNGGPGYVEAGRPHKGILNSAVKVSASDGWSYSSLQKSDDPQSFGISGFNATAERDGETLTFVSETPISVYPVEIDVTVGPGQGAIEVRIDDNEPVRHSLAAARRERTVFWVPAGPKRTFSRLEIKTVGDAPVTVSGVGIFGRKRGVALSKIGFPGATVEVLDRMDAEVFSREMKRLRPDIVVLAFGTNEGFNDDLDLDAYAARFGSVLQKVRKALPDAKIVLIAPPYAERVKGEKASACGYPTPLNLVRVRALILGIAKRLELAVWDWASVMPAKCSVSQWVAADPKLMADDRVHLTRAGYELSARSFAKFLEPMIADLTETSHALPNH